MRTPLFRWLRGVVILQALQKIGMVGLLHAGTGALILLLTIINLVLALSSRVRSVWIFGVLAFLSTFGAVSTGTLFTLSGFQNDGYSHGMATNFLLTFSFFFIELYMLKPVPVTKTPR